MNKQIKNLFDQATTLEARSWPRQPKELFDKDIHTDYKIDKTLLNDLLETMEIGSLCALGGGLPLPIKNALMYFEEDLKEFIR